MMLKSDLAIQSVWLDYGVLRDGQLGGKRWEG